MNLIPRVVSRCPMNRGLTFCFHISRMSTNNHSDDNASKPITSNPAWQSLMSKLQLLNDFRIHTGNINNYVELKLKRFQNSAEELIACLDLQFASLDANIDVTGNNMLLLSNRGHADTVYERDDLKITLKVFLPDFNVQQMHDAVDATINQLKTDNIEQLILALPHSENTKMDEHKELDGEWFERIAKAWSEAEKLVDSGKVVSVGVADFEYPALQKLIQTARHKPCVDHYNIEGCCVVPPELQKLAKENDVQLLTHNDPEPFPLKEIFRSFCNLSECAPICNVSFKPTWAARYTVWVRRRSLMASKGFIVQHVVSLVMNFVFCALFLLAFLQVVVSQRLYLDPHRKLSWKQSNPNYGPYRGQPEQVHLSYGGDPSKVFVTFLTFDDVGQTIVDYGIGKLDHRVNATISTFVDQGPLKSTRYIHRALIENIQAGQRYMYRVGSEDFGVSNIFSFVGLKERPEGGYKYAVFGDMGNYNARSLGRLQRQAQNGDFDIVLHVGDLAYNLDTDDGMIGDEFMRQIEPVASTVIYQVTPGNHEYAQNFTHYVNRFTMPNTDTNLWYSYDVGNVHFVSFSTEVYFNLLDGFEPLKNQWNWLVQDLKKANANRNQVPWIITLGHRPMYCSTDDSDDCRRIESRIRTGIPLTHSYCLEKLFYSQGVDLMVWAHEHTYERLWPVYDRVVYNGTDEPNVDPPAPVHVLSGSAGCQEYTDMFADAGIWDAVRSNNYGFSHMHVFNSTHLHWQQIRATDGKIEDDFWLIKNKHGPYNAEDLRRLKRHGTYVPYSVKSPIKKPSQDPSEL
ncbi:Purple acid phosphatase [Aphelenchoides besseyi]|nr:Purple acid phosphatase [Aphelenchoides besseyi]